MRSGAQSTESPVEASYSQRPISGSTIPDPENYGQAKLFAKARKFPRLPARAAPRVVCRWHLPCRAKLPHEPDGKSLPPRV